MFEILGISGIVLPQFHIVNSFIVADYHDPISQKSFCDYQTMLYLIVLISQNLKTVLIRETACSEVRRINVAYLRKYNTGVVRMFLLVANSNFTVSAVNMTAGEILMMLLFLCHHNLFVPKDWILGSRQECDQVQSNQEGEEDEGQPNYSPLAQSVITVHSV